MTRATVTRLAVGAVMATALAWWAGGAPQASGKTTMVVCHYSRITGQWNTLSLGPAAAAKHLLSHSRDYEGACR